MSLGQSDNYHSSSSDAYSSSSGSAPQVSLADALKAVVAVKELDPMLVYHQLPRQVADAVDASAQQMGQKKFADLTGDQQRTIFSALLKAFSGAPAKK